MIIYNSMPLSNKKFVLIGFDSMTPQLLFEWVNELNTFRELMESSIYGRLKSTIPPITIPAWPSLTSGKDPGVLGCYGLRNRKDYSYSNLSLVNSLFIKEQHIWDILSKYNKRSIVISVPPSYPTKQINGFMVSCFFTPNSKCQYTYPESLKYEVESIVGEYIFDIKNFRKLPKDLLEKEIYKMSEQRFKLTEYFLKNKEWDFFMMVDMGVDRVQHAFWDNKDIIKKYYKYLDVRLKGILELIDNNTAVMIASDHGAKDMRGGFCINDWLIKEGYLKLKKIPTCVTLFDTLLVDWENTSAWADGGYYGRIFLNVKGREPYGILDGDSYKKTIEEISNKLKEKNTEIFIPADVYKQCNGIPPDIIAYFDNLELRSIGSIGNSSLIVKENDIGPDAANHSSEGIFILYNPENKFSRDLSNIDILDCAPTVLNWFDIPIPEDMVGKVYG